MGSTGSLQLQKWEGDGDVDQKNIGFAGGILTVFEI
jgi:hypothetical protein